MLVELQVVICRRLVYSSMLWIDFGSQRIKWITKWKASYFTHPALYYPVPQTSMPLSAAKFMTSLPAESISKEAEITMKEWAEHYRPVRQRTVGRRHNERQSRRSSTSCVREDKTWNMDQAFFSRSSTATVSNESVLLPTSFDCTVVTFVSGGKIRQVLIATEPWTSPEGWIWKWLGQWLWWNRIRDCRTQNLLIRLIIQVHQLMEQGT